MSDGSAFASGFALSAALIVAIGPQNAFVLQQGLRREHVGTVVLFCAAIDALLMAAGVAGVGAALRHAPTIAALLSLGGAAFLVCYGLSAFRRAWRAGAALGGSAGARLDQRAALARAAGFTLLNPHVYLDTLVLVGTVGAAWPPQGRPLFVAGASLASLAWLLGLGYGAAALAGVFARASAWRVLDVAVGLTMVTLGAKLARDTLVP